MITKRLLLICLGIFISTLAFSNKSPDKSDADLIMNGKITLDDTTYDHYHPKKRPFRGKTVTRSDYVKTHNPKRKIWNKIHERNNPVKSNPITKCPKRATLVRLISKHRTDVGSPQSTFVKRKRRNG